jgi:hypothetical protein
VVVLVVQSILELVTCGDMEQDKIEEDTME